MRTQAILTYAPNIMLTNLKRWWLKQKRDFFLQSAEIEDAKAQEARHHAAHFRVRAVRLEHELRRLS